MAGGPEHHPPHPTPPLEEILPKEAGRVTRQDILNSRASGKGQGREDEDREKRAVTDCKGRGLCEEHENKLANQNNSQPPGSMRTEPAKGRLSGKDDAYLSL